MKRQGGVRAIIIMAVFAAVFTSASFANLIYVDSITTEYRFNTWYTGGQINFVNTGGSAINGFSAGGVEQTITNAKLTFVSEMLNDSASSGGIARGTFQGGVTVTLNGTIGNYTGVLLQGTMVETSFVLEELYTDASKFQELVHLDLDAVGLASAGGISIGDGHTYKMFDPKMDLVLQSSSTVENFHSGDLTSPMVAPPSIIAFSAVPEPMTLMLVGFGTLFLRKRKS